MSRLLSKNQLLEEIQQYEPNATNNDYSFNRETYASKLKWFTKCHTCNIKFVRLNSIATTHHIFSNLHQSNKKEHKPNNIKANNKINKEYIWDIIKSFDEKTNINDFNIIEDETGWKVICIRCDKTIPWRGSLALKTHIYTGQHNYKISEDNKKREREPIDDNNDIDNIKDLMIKKFKKDCNQSMIEYSFKDYTDKIVNDIGKEIITNEKMKIKKI